MDKTIDTAVGPDGIPYSCWKGPFARAFRYQYYRFANSELEHQRLIRDVQECLLVFLGKGDH